MAPLNILIVGCGVGGTTLASFLLLGPDAAREKPHITILERAASIPAYGQNVDIRGAGATIIRKLGLETAIRSSTTNEEGVLIVDANNRVWGTNAADKTGKIQTGTSDIEILRGTLADILYRRSRTVSDEVKKDGGVGIEYVFGDYLEDVWQDEQKVHVRFARSREERTFDVVVGADGLQSRTRRMVFGQSGEEDRVKRLGMYVGFFSLPKGDTDSLWRRWYHAPSRRSIMLRPHEHKDKSTVFMGVINDDQRLIDVASGPDRSVEAQKALLKEYFQDAGWESERIIREMEAADDFYYDMVAQIKMDKWSDGRVVLLGDAGYCASPISGMGTTLALNGAYNLAGSLLRHPGEHAAAYAAYEQRMRPIVDRAQKLAPGMPHLIHPETAWGVWVLHLISWFMCSSGVMLLAAKFAGPPANVVPVEEFGFRTLADSSV